MTFTDHEVAIIRSALLAASDQYVTDAHKADMSNMPRLAEHFRLQSREVLALANRIDCDE
jgi:hypothetical protein